MVRSHQDFASHRSNRGRRWWRWGAVLFCLSAALLQAAEWYVAPDASRNGIGTIDDPWPLQTAVDRITPVGPGDVVWLRGGIYQSNYLFYLTGESNRYITVRPYANERVIFDGSPFAPNAFPILIEGAWTIYRDFEVIHSTTWTNNSTPVAIQCLGPHVKLINLVIHDAGQGIGFWNEAINSEVYGCIVYYNGSDPQEHGIYTQNDVGTKRIADSIIFNNTGYGIHAYAQNGYSRGYEFNGNVLFQNGRDNGELFVGSFHPGDRLTVVSNYSLAFPELTEPIFRLSDRDHSSNPNGTAIVRGNYLIGGAGFTAQDFRDLTFQDNVVVSGYVLTHCRPPPGTTFADYHWDRNHYSGAEVFSIGTTNYNFANWKAATGLDSSSVYQNASPSGVNVFVRPNQYQPKRAHVVIYNWDLQDNVQVDLRGVLEAGDPYVVQNVSDYFGRPVLTNIYTGGLVTLPMTNLSVAVPARNQAPPLHTGPFFATFVVAKPYEPPSDLIAQWSMNENVGSITYDTVGSHHGTFGGQPLWVPGLIGAGLRFRGEDYINIPDAPELDLTNDMSVSLWFKPAQLVAAATGRQDLLAKYISYWLLLNYPFNDGRLAFTFNSGAPLVRSTRERWEPNQWYHVVGIFNGTEMKLYVNGELEGATNTTQRAAETPYPLQLGGNSVQRIFFNGDLDEVRLFDYALLPEQVLELYQQPGLTNGVPTLEPIPDRSLAEETLLIVTPLADDSDDLANPLTFRLDPGTPEGMTIDPNLGTIRWTPSESQGPAIYPITVRVDDNDTPNLSASRTFNVTVAEVNKAPRFSPIAPQTLAEESTLVLFNLAADPDVPPNNLAFALEPGAPPTARINPFSGGVFVWTPSEIDGPSTNMIVLRVTDNGQPPQSVTQSFTITVTETPQPPQLDYIPDQVVTEGNTLVVAASATDFDFPANSLIYSLGSDAPPGAVIDPLNGLLRWPATSPPSARTLTIRVTDDGNPPLTGSRPVRVNVLPRPQLGPITLRDNLLTISWNAIAGQTYRLQSSTNLGTAAWLDVPGDVVAPGDVASKTDLLTSGKRFYRVLQLP